MARNVNLHSHPSRVEHWRHVAEIVAFAAAATWAIYIFVYQERIKPATATPQLQSTFGVESHRLNAGRTYVKIHLEMKNIGESLASVGLVNVNVYGVSYGAKVAAFSNLSTQGIIQTGYALPPAPDRFLSSFTNRWHAFGTDKTLILRPGTTFDESFDFALPAHSVDSLKLRYVICWTLPTQRTWKTPFVHNADGSYVYDAGSLYRTDQDVLTCHGNRRGEPYPLTS